MAGGQEYSLNLGLDVLPISTDKDNLPDLNRLYNAVKGVARCLDTYTNTLSPQEDEWQAIGFGYNRIRNLTKSYVIAGEDLAAGNFVEFYTDAGILKARIVNPPTSIPGPRPPCGFVQESFVSGNFAEIYLAGLLTNIAGLVLGTHYWYYWDSSDIIGPTYQKGFITTAAAAAAAGFMSYYVGQAVTDTAIYCPGFTRNSSLAT